MANLPPSDYNAELQESKAGTLERMKAIIHVLEAPIGILMDQHIDEGYIGVLLDELQDLVSSVDMSLAFHSEGGLFPLLNCLKTYDAAVRGKAANVVATLAWGNFPSQKLVMEGFGFKAIFEVFTSDPCVVIRTNALGAIFSLIRSNKAAISSFRRANGYDALRDPLTSEDVCYQRRALDLIYLILEEDSEERKIMHEQGIHHMMARLGNSEDAKVRESALWGLLKLARLMDDKNDNIKYDFDYAVQPVLEERIAHIVSLSGEELVESRTERVLVDTLWRTCFDESSFLEEIGFLVLPGEEALSSNLEREPFAHPVGRLDVGQVTKKQRINNDYNAELRESKTGTVERMKAIIHVLEAPIGVLMDQHIDEGHLGVLLDELQDLVSSVDMSLAFHSEGGLFPLLNCLKTYDADVRGKAANVVATLAWGNFPSQKLVMKGFGFKALFEVFTSDPRVVIRTNALGALFSLIRGNKAAISSFRRANGYDALRDPLTSEDVCYQRKALDLIYLILEEDSEERKIMHEQGIHHMMARLGNSEDAKVRESALWGLLKLARLMDDKNDNIKYDFDYAVQPVLEERIAHIVSLSGEELVKSRTERVLVDTLWRTCFDESSFLEEIGFLVLPGEEALSSNLEREPFAHPVGRLDVGQVTKKQRINNDYNAELRESKTGTVERMKAIIHVLEAPIGVLMDQHIDEGHLGVLLDELQDLVSSVDMSLAFHSEGGLFPLLNCLKTYDADVRGKAANVVATLAWGNFPSQKLVMKGFGFKALFEVFTSDPRVVIRTNALGALFSLIRGNKAAISSFRRANGYDALRDPLTSEDVCYQRKALDLIYLILEEDSEERKIMQEQGIHHMMARLGNSEDAKVRESALWGLLKLARLMDDKNDNIKYDFDYAVQPVLEERIAHIVSLSGEELVESRTERVLVDTLWRTCFDESSFLEEIGFLVLPGEEALSSNLEREPFAHPVGRLDIGQVTKKQRINK